MSSKDNQFLIGCVLFFAGSMGMLYSMCNICDSKHEAYRTLYNQAVKIADTNSDGKLSDGEKVGMYNAMGIELPEPRPTKEQLKGYLEKHGITEKPE